MQDDALPFIQLAVTPVILITGLGSLMITMTNRLGRIVDRSRILAGQVRAAEDGDDRIHLQTQLCVMYRRAKLVRLAVTLTSSSMFTSGLLVVAIFLKALLKTDLATLIVALFITSILFMLLSLAVFIRDIFMSLTALGIEVDRAMGARPPASAVSPPDQGPDEMLSSG